MNIRLMGTQEELKQWSWLFKKLQEKQLIAIASESEPYQNRNSTEYRVYINASLNISFADEDKAHL